MLSYTLVILALVAVGLWIERFKRRYDHPRE